MKRATIPSCVSCSDGPFRQLHRRETERARPPNLGPHGHNLRPEATWGRQGAQLTRGATANKLDWPLEKVEPALLTCSSGVPSPPHPPRPSSPSEGSQRGVLDSSSHNHVVDNQPEEECLKLTYFQDRVSPAFRILSLYC